MSSERCYLGPFGRYLPIPDNSPTTERPDSRGGQAAHAMYQLPPPKIPSPLQFGTDGMSNNTPPGRYEYRTNSYGTRDAERPTFKETLPSVSQLLTPMSHASVPASPFSPQNRQTPPFDRSMHSSPARDPYDPPPPQAISLRQPYPVPQRPYAATQSSYHPSGPESNQQAASYPTASNPGPWPRQDNQLLDDSRRSYEPQTVPYHQGQLPYQSVVLNGVSRSPSFHSRVESQSERSGGQRFLQVVREEHIPGEGICYVYEDGSHCRKFIDGEPVNASWGVTKAGKPRKRLAQACMTCREKKIKCDPNTPKCVQCQKFGRECRFESA
jgi:hypothetical protein